MTYLVGHIPGRISSALYQVFPVDAKTSRIVPAAYFVSDVEAAAFAEYLTTLETPPPPPPPMRPSVTTLETDQLVRS